MHSWPALSGLLRNWCEGEAKCRVGAHRLTDFTAQVLRHYRALITAKSL